MPKVTIETHKSGELSSSTEMERIHPEIPVGQIAKIKRYARSQGLTLSGVIQRAVTAFFNEEKA